MAVVSLNRPCGACLSRMMVLTWQSCAASCWCWRISAWRSPWSLPSACPLIRLAAHAGAFTQGLQKIGWFGGCRGLPLRDLLALELRLHQFGQRFFIPVVELGRVVATLLGADDMGGEFEHLLVDLDLCHVFEGLVRRADLVIEIERGADQPVAVGTDQHCPQPPEKHGAGDRCDARLLHAVAQKRKGFLAELWGAR